MSTDVQTVFYVLSTLALFGAAVGFVRRKYRESLEREKAEAAEKANLARALQNNAAASDRNALETQKNSEMLGNVSRQMSEFMTEASNRMDRHGRALADHDRQLAFIQRSQDSYGWRIGRLETNLHRFHPSAEVPYGPDPQVPDPQVPDPQVPDAPDAAHDPDSGASR